VTATSSAFSDSSGTTSAPGSATNIAADPLITSDLGLGVGSPAIDRGSAAGSTGSLDLAGAPRALDGNGDGTAVPDIGAFERPAVPFVKDVAPSLSGVSMTNKTFAPLAKGAKASARKHKSRVKRGTRFRYRLSKAATVTLTIDRARKGRRVKIKGKKGKTRCAAPTKTNRKRRRCTRYRRAGVLKASKGAGRGSTAFSGRFKGRALKAGTYRATIVARDASGLSSKPRRLTFRIVRP
jgi:hypothetical protein